MMPIPASPQGARLQPPEIRLLLLAARPNWSEAQAEMATSLIGQVTQWDVFIDTALRKYVLPMVYENLATLGDNVVAPDLLGTLRRQSMELTAQMLRRHAAFEWFHTQCVIPSGVEHVYFKGPAIAARFYPNPMQRFYRDIDILVPNARRIDLLRRMRDQGGLIYVNTVAAEPSDLQTDAEMHDFLAVTKTPVVIFPNGLLVELHNQLDPVMKLFDTRRLVATALQLPMHGWDMRVVRDDFHVAYLVYHHSKHFWSKLNWLADLAAICGDERMRLDAASTVARNLRIGSTLTAAMELYRMAAVGQLPQDMKGSTPGADLLQACIEGLHGDDELELEKRPRRRMRAFGFDWQEMPIPFWRRALLQIDRFRPSYDDLRRVPGGHRLQPLRYVAALGVRVLRGTYRRIRGAEAP